MRSDPCADHRVNSSLLSGPGRSTFTGGLDFSSWGLRSAVGVHCAAKLARRCWCAHQRFHAATAALLCAFRGPVVLSLCMLPLAVVWSIGLPDHSGDDLAIAVCLVVVEPGCVTGACICPGSSTQRAGSASTPAGSRALSASWESQLCPRSGGPAVRWHVTAPNAGRDQGRLRMSARASSFRLSGRLCLPCC